MSALGQWQTWVLALAPFGVCALGLRLLVGARLREYHGASRQGLRNMMDVFSVEDLWNLNKQGVLNFVISAFLGIAAAVVAIILFPNLADPPVWVHVFSAALGVVGAWAIRNPW